MDIATLTNAPREITLAGLPYRVRPLVAREWGQLHQWLKDHSEDPVTLAIHQIARAKATGAPITPDQEAYLMAEGRREARTWPPRVTSPAWLEALGEAPGGDVEFLRAIVATNQPSFTTEQAQDLAGRVSGEESAQLMLLALGLEPSPKASGPTDAAMATRKGRPRPNSTTGRKRSTR